MIVTLFRAFPDPYRKSMQIYADQLRRGVAALVGPGEQIRECALPAARLAPRWARYWDQYVRYQRLAREQASDVNHIVDHGYGHLATSLPPARTVVTFHDAIVVKVPGIGLRTRLSLSHSLRAMRGAARIVTDSAQSRADLLEILVYPPDRAHVVYPGIAPAFRPPVDREALRRTLGFARPTILHVGHTQPYMNLPRVLGALDALVRRSGVDAEFVKVGGGLTDEQRRLVERHGLSDRVKEVGPVPLDRLVDLCGAADVLIYPPLYAGFGLPPLEAMACGTPVVCSNRGSLPEVVGEAAELCDAEDEAALARALATLLTDTRAREKRRALGLARAAQFSWDATARAMLQVYREVGGG
jgi:glycosyltransferase involved in cell wall biosynthesis